MRHDVRPAHVPAPHNAAAVRPLWIARLCGDQVTMGRQHGELLRPYDGWAEAIDHYPDLPARMLLGPRPRGPIGRALGRAAMAVSDRLLDRLDAARPADYRARSQAFFAALGRDPGHARYLAVMDLFQNGVNVAASLRLGPFSRPFTAAAVHGAMPACSSVAVWDGAAADGALRHARNFDFPGVGIWDRSPTVVFCSPARGLRYGFIATRGADTPGITAFNEAGLTIGAHTRFHRDVRSRGAMAVDLGHDLVRRCETLADAVKVARERPSASTWGFLVSSARERRAVVLELSGHRCEVVEVSGSADSLVCTNRNRHPAMIAGQLAASPSWAAHSDTRERRLAELVAAGRDAGGMSVAALAAALGDRVDPTDPSGRERGSGGILAQPCTVKSVVVEPEARVLHLAVGGVPAARGPWLRVPWDWDGAPGAAEVALPPAPPRDVADEAFACFVEAARVQAVGAGSRAVAAELELAVALQPEDPSYRFLAGLLALRRGELTVARAHFEVGLRREGAPFRRAQQLLWASRAAALAGDDDATSRLRAGLFDLAASGGDGTEGIASLAADARRDACHGFSAAQARRMAVNLMMGDAI